MEAPHLLAPVGFTGIVGEAARHVPPRERLGRGRDPLRVLLLDQSGRTDRQRATESTIETTCELVPGSEVNFTFFVTFAPSTVNFPPSALWFLLVVSVENEYVPFAPLELIEVSVDWSDYSARSSLAYTLHRMMRQWVAGLRNDGEGLE